MHRVQQGHEQVLVGQDNGRLDTYRGFPFTHEYHLIEGLLGLAHGRRHGNHPQCGLRPLQWGHRHRAEPLAVTVDQQCGRIMRRLVEQSLDARIVPPKIGLVVILELLEQGDFGSREDTKADEHKTLVAQRFRLSLGSYTQLSARGDDTPLVQFLVIIAIDGGKGIPQAHELTLHLVIALFRIGVRAFAVMLPQFGLGIGIKECGEQPVAEDLHHLLLDRLRQVIACQTMQVAQVLIDIVRVGQRLVDVVEVSDDELGPIDELVKLLGCVTHGATIGVIQGKHHLDIGCCDS